MAKLARRDPKLRKELEPKPFPSWLSYLRDWTNELHGRSGIGMSGLAPLSYTTIESWSRLRRIHPEPHEVYAIVMLDSAMLNPGE